MKRPETAVGHLDADCFYVSAERVRDAFLCEKAVGVLGNQGACVIAKSYEMKAAGVGTGMPIWDALVKCPMGVYVKRDFHWYEVLSRMMLEVVRDLSPRVEYYSIDEFFFLAPPPRGKSFQEMAEAIRDRIWERVRVPVTVGIARTRTLAKLISDAAKPFGALAVLDVEAEAHLLADRPVTEITGIAGRRAARLMPWGIRTCLDLARADRRLVRSLLTASGETLWWELNGDPVQPIQPHPPGAQGPVARGEPGRGHRRPDRALCLAGPPPRAADRGARIPRGPGGPADGLGRLQERPRGGRPDVARGPQRPLRPAPGRGPPLPPTRMDPPGAGEPDAPHRRAVDAEEPGPPGPVRAPRRAPEAVARLKRAVNDRHGRFTLRSAATLPLVAIYGDPANAYDICDVRGKMCF